jgi:predicted nucleic acid-binding protein
MSVKRITLDTNILIYAVDKDAGKKHERAIEVIDQAIFLDSVLTLQVLCEFYAATTKKRYAQHEEVIIFIKGWMEMFPIVEGHSSTLPLALKAVAKHKLSFWDAMLWATAKEARCTLLLSEDFQNNFNLDGVQIKNPFLSDEPIEKF